MDKNQVHPDTSVVNKTNEEWQKILPADVFYVARQRAQKDHIPVNLNIRKKSEHIIAPFAVIHYFVVIPNLKADVAGRVFMSR